MNGAQAVLVDGVEEGSEVGFVVRRGASTRLPAVEPPDSAVDEDAPAEIAAGDVLGTGEVAKDVAVG